MVSAGNMAFPNFSETLEREPRGKIKQPRDKNIPQENLCWSSECRNAHTTSRIKCQTYIQGRNRQPDNCRRQGLSQPGIVESTRENPSAEYQPHIHEISVRCSDITSRPESEQRQSESQRLPPQNATVDSNMERASSVSRRASIKQHSFESELVIRSFNCEGWKDNLMIEMLCEISDNHTKNVILCCQETWKYKLSTYFMKKVEKHYTIIHESGMDETVPKGPGRPYGGVCMIISNQISHKPHYRNKQCISILLNDSGVLLSNVYMPFKNSRISVEENIEKYMEALGHLRASHETC